MAKKPKQLYSVHPGVAMVQKWIADLPTKTGKNIDEWMEFIRMRGPGEEKAVRDWLKKEFGFGTNTASWLAERAHGNRLGLADDDPKAYLAEAPKYVDEMLSGPRAGLRPVYDALLDTCLSLADDVKACPCKTIVPIYRQHVIAQIKPATRTRIDFGLALRDLPATGNLIDTGGFAKKDRITHKLGVSSARDINAELKKWLRRAYALDA
ncbi:MAG: DUF4287 domain-containing protein [Gemmataceae bacterium]|nr:DUF4287 domain-containing protein [Gemmataceae bacterium]